MPGSCKLHNGQIKSNAQSRNEILLTLMRKLGLAEDQDEYQETLEITNLAELEECRQQVLLIAKGLTQHCEFCVITEASLEDAINTFKILKHLDELEIIIQRKEKERVKTEVTDVSAEEEAELRSMIYTAKHITETEMTPPTAIEPSAGKDAVREEEVKEEELAIADDSAREDKKRSLEFGKDQTSDLLDLFAVTGVLKYQITAAATAVPSVRAKPWIGLQGADDKVDTCEEVLIGTQPVTGDVEEFDIKPVVSISAKVSHLKYVEQNLDGTIDTEEHTTLKSGSGIKVREQGSLETEKHTLAEEVGRADGRERESLMEDSEDEDIITEEELAQAMQYTDDDDEHDGATAAPEEFRKEVLEDTVTRAQAKPLAAMHQETVPKKTVLREGDETLQESRFVKDLPLDSKVIIEVIEAKITEDTFKNEHAFILNELIRLRDALQNAIYRLAKGAEDGVSTPGESVSTEPEVFAAPQRMFPPRPGSVGESRERELPPSGHGQSGASAAESKRQLKVCIAKLSSAKQFLDQCSSPDGFEKLGNLVGFPAGCCDMDDCMFHVHGFLNGVPAVVSLDLEDESLPSSKCSTPATILFKEKVSMTVEKAVESIPLRSTSCTEKFDEVSSKPQSKDALLTVAEEPLAAEKVLSHSVEQLPRDDAYLLTGSPSVGVPYYPAVISLPHVNRDPRDELVQLGSDVLATAAIPAPCCKQSAVDEQSDESVPYSVSLRSLPLSRADVDDIKERIRQNTRADTNAR